jgi:hypothetical protein
MAKDLFDLGIERRLIHVALVIMVVVGVRACGGAPQAEDRVNAASQWMAEKTGLESAKSTWNKTIRRSVGSTTTRASNAVYGSMSRFLDGVEATVDGVGVWVNERVKRTTEAIDNGLHATLTPDGRNPQTNKIDVPASTNGQRPATR